MNKALTFTPVFDSRKRKLRNLWQRGDRYYARIKIAYPGEDRTRKSKPTTAKPSISFGWMPKQTGLRLAQKFS